jgi:hypothetical protein
MPLDTDRRKKQVGSGDRLATFIDDNLFDDPNTKISAFGTLHAKTKTERDKVIEAERSKMKEDLTADDVGGDVGPRLPFQTTVEKRWTGRKHSQKTYDDYYTQLWLEKKIRRIRGKQHVLSRIAEIGERVVGHKELTDELVPVKGQDLDVTGKKITWERVKQWVRDPNTSPDIEMGLPSYAQFIKNFISDEYSWAPDNLTLTSDLLPEGYIKGSENHYKSLLREFDDDPVARQRLDRLYNHVEKPETAEYMTRYHTTDKTKIEFAQDAQGTTELYSDWSMPYKHRINEVKFQHHIAKQINFGYDAGETV